MILRSWSRRCPGVRPGAAGVEGHRVISWDWFTEPIRRNVTAAALAEKFGAPPEEVVYGMAPAIVGTIIITGWRRCSRSRRLLGAIYLNEYGRKGHLATILRFFTDVMTGVPSVIMGIFIYTLWVLAFGRSGMAGALASPV